MSSRAGFRYAVSSHYDWQGGFIGDTANRPVDRHDSPNDSPNNG
jgi:hypothetical protein